MTDAAERRQGGSVSNGTPTQSFPKRPSNGSQGDSLPPPSDIPPPTVFVIDDEVLLRTFLERRLRSAGYRVECFASAREFLSRPPFAGCGCILLDIQMPGMSGVELQEEMAKSNDAMPVIFITACADLNTCVKVMKKGADNFLTKPFDEASLLAAIRPALEKDRIRRQKQAARAQAERLIDSLTPRELEVMVLLIAGKLNKQIAAELGIAEITVKVHRRQIMDKTGVTSLVELMRVLNQAKGLDDSD